MSEPTDADFLYCAEQIIQMERRRRRAELRSRIWAIATMPLVAIFGFAAYAVGSMLVFGIIDLLQRVILPVALVLFCLFWIYIGIAVLIARYRPAHPKV